MKTFFEIKERDLAARIGSLKTNHGTIETPTVLPVINPNRQLIPAKEMKKYGAEAVITNSYILWKDKQEDVRGKGVHDFLDYSGPVMTDSGAFQLMEYGDIEVSNEEIIEFQKSIGVDIGVILDVPTASQEKKITENNVKETLKRAAESKKFTDEQRLWCGPVQGGIHTSILKKSAKRMGELDFDIYPIGSVVPLMVQYKFADVLNIVREAKQILPADKPVHLFGAGHPMFFSFAAAMGCDLFDSAAYALFAKDKRYLTPQGTYDLDEMKEFPCSCPICSTHSPSEFNEEKLAQHNLYVTFEEIKTIRQSIRDGTLFELLETRAAAHPKLYSAMKAIVSKKSKQYLNTQDPISKKHVFESSEFSKHQPAIQRAKDRIVRGDWKNEKIIKIPLYGNVPKSVLNCFPFSQTTFAADFEAKGKQSEEAVRASAKYWYGADIFPEKIRVRRSPKTQRIREISADGKMLASVRAEDFMIILHDASKSLHAKTKLPAHRVVINDPDVEKFIREGKSVFSKFVVDCDKSIVPGQQVLVVNKKDELIASGNAVISAREMMELEQGMAVKIRWTNK